ncbi:putative histone deacetylase [Phaeomoniella chlamydospora]|uniref:Putative histone deacetylase n=1 Tax=Phaeomoniella chlamydospora TaxID=158046 RepID=A0A0G2EVR3_PHACM|nr:putative histone deacetylase [Phaeomoniella chlamydospora]
MASPSTRTVVILHDSCYGHRFSRPRTTKAVLNTIVERPERILAGVLGLSTAYVRLGERYQGGRHAPKHGQKNNATPPFKFHKTDRTVSLTSAAATHVHPQKWMDELKIMCETAESKLAANGKELVRPEGTENEDDGTLRPKLHEGDLYLCSESLNALEGCLGGVCEGVDFVFNSSDTKRAFVCIRPPGHHCSSDYPSGFCWLNNVHVGITHAAITHGLTHAAIIDFDLHHGDGSQAVAWDHNAKASTLPKNAPMHKKTPIGYYSLHDINSYPCEYGDEEKVRSASLCIENAHGQSIWNVHLEPWKTHQDFWELYKSRYSVLLQKARSFLRHHTSRLRAVTNGPTPKAAIFLSAGFDASEWEGAGMQRHKVNVPTDFYARFTADVVRLSEEEGLGVDGRVISVLEGGYSDRALTSGILSHVCGLACGAEGAETMKEAKSLEKQIEGLEVSSQDDVDLPRDRLRLDIDWWAPHHLETLEALTGKAQPPPPPKKAKEITPGNYSSPTTASTARSVSLTHRDRLSFTGEIGVARQLSPKPEPPLPEVDWATAAVELSKLIIPTGRTTLSCRHDELNAEATRARKARQSMNGVGQVGLGPVNGDGERKMQLRERKTRVPPPEVPSNRAPSRTNRRKTIAALNELDDISKEGTPEDASSGSGRAASRSQRRISDASSIVSGFSNMQIEEKTEADRSSKVSSRAPSAVPGSIPAPPKAPVIRKSRPATSTVSRGKTPTSGRSSPKEAVGVPPVPRVPSGYSQKSTASQHVRMPSQTANLTRGPTATAPGSNIDDLTNSVGKLKINLKVPTPEENAAREKARAQTQLQGKELKERKPRAPRKPAVPKPAKTVAPRKETISTASRQIKENPQYFPPTSQALAMDSALNGAATSAVPTFTANSNEVPVAQPPILDTIPAPAAPSPISNEGPPTIAASLESSEGKMGPGSESSSNRLAVHNLLSKSDVYTSEQSSVPPQINSVPASATAHPEPSAAYEPPNVSAPATQESIVSPDVFAVPAKPASESVQPHQAHPSSAKRPSTDSRPSSSSLPTSPSNIKRTKADLPVFTSSSPIPFSSSRPGTSNGLPSTQSGHETQQAMPIKQEEPADNISSLSENNVAIPAPTTKPESSIWDVPETPRH